MPEPTMPIAAAREVFTCNDCGRTRPIEERAVREVRHNWSGERIITRFCVDCSTRCGECGELGRTDTCQETISGTVICEECVNDGNHVYVERLDAYACADDCVTVRNQFGHVLWELSDHAEAHYMWCEPCQLWEHETYRCDVRNPPAIQPYHSGPRNPLPVLTPWVRAHRGRMFGVELEVECGTNDAEECAARVLTASRAPEFLSTVLDGADARGDLIRIEHDGSLRNGFEIITRPMGLDAHRRFWRALLVRDVTRGLVSHNVSTCGIHVHVTRNTLTRMQLAKVVKFINEPAHEPLVRAIARRYGNGYCEIKQKYSLPACQYPDDRYDAVNITGARTVEFRLFKGSLRADAVVAAIEFCHALAAFCADTSPVGIAIHADNFLTFIASAEMRRETDTLRMYLGARGYRERFPARHPRSIGRRTA